MGKKILNLLLFLAVTAGAIVITLFVGKDQPSVMLYNFVFMGIMVALYLAGMFGGMFRMDDLSEAFKRATDEISSIFKIPGKAKAEDLQVLEQVFDNKYLDKKLEDFTEAISKTEEGIGDVEDYINEEELDLHIHKRLLEMVPDIFTSLGILGTFVGLVWGLKNFQPNNYEVITSSVMSLLDGIKVAFLTSIYGIAFSIVYSYGMKSEYSGMAENLQSFLNRFHSYVMPNAENESRNLLIASQKIQTDAMKQMAEQFSVQMAGSFEKVITPTFQKMNNSLDLLVSSVTKVQTDAVQEILEVFLDEMKASFKMQFDDFNEALANMTAAQKQNTEYTAGLYQSLSRKLAESYDKQDRAMRDTVTQLGNIQTRFLQTTGKITQENAAIQKQQQQDYEHVVQYMKDAEQSAAKFWVACNQTMKRYVEAATEGMQTVTAAGKGVTNSQESFQKIAADFQVKMKEYAEYQKRSYRTMEQVQRLLNDISAVGTKDAYLMGGREDTIAQQRALDSIQRMMEEQYESQQAVLKEISKNLREANRNAQKGKFGFLK